MKLSESTLNVLKNFSTINTGLQVKPGQVVRTISKQQNVLAKATVPETFDSEFVIYDLNRFLGTVTSLNDPEITINTEMKNMLIESGSAKTTYGLSDEAMIVAPPAKELKVEGAEVSFELTKDNYNQILKMSGILGLPNIAVIGDGRKVSIVTLDAKNDQSDNFSIELADNKEKFKFLFNVENLKMIPGDYDVSISSKGISHFKSKNAPVEYWIATEAGSKYGE
jgi:hypothetical protein